jgi:hypothetical protein
MEIIPRSQSGLAPPRGTVPSGIKKKYIIIHYTCSGNGILSPQAEQNIMRMWQTMHESQYGAVDILQGFSVFQSGRIYENRVPWDSNHGAIYNAGGGQYDGVGIENQGDFRGSVLMDDTQYQALLYLCVELVRKLNIPLNGPVVLGHKQIYPCRPGDSKSTDCPANLLPQLLTSGKLKNDIIAQIDGTQPPVIKEEEEARMATLKNGKHTKFSTWIDGHRNVYVDVVNNLDNGKISTAKVSIAGDGGKYGVIKPKGEDVLALEGPAGIQRLDIPLLTKWNIKFPAAILKVECLSGEICVKFIEEKK